MNPLNGLYSISMEIRSVLTEGRGKKLSANYLARHVAEEVGECVGAHNHYVDGRGTRNQFAHEWAQALTNLIMLGACHLTPRQMTKALRDVLADHQQKWRTP